MIATTKPPLEARKILSVRFTKDGKNIIFTKDNGEVRVEDLKGNFIKVFLGLGSYILSPDQKTIVFTPDQEKTIKIWDYEGNFLRKTIYGNLGSTDVAITDRPYFVPELDSEELRILDFSPDSRLFISTGNNNSAKIWKLDGTPIATLSGHTQSVKSSAFSSDGKTIATASFDGTVKLWNLDGKVTRTITGHSGPVNIVQFNSEGDKLITGSSDGTVRIWSLQPIAKTSWQAHGEPIFDLKFSPDGKNLATASRDRTIKIWDENYALKHTLTGHDRAVKSISFSPSSEIIASSEGTYRNTRSFRLWKRDGTFLKEATVAGYDGHVFEAKFNPKDNSIASTSRRGLGLWTSEGNFMTSLNNPEEEVRCTRRISFSYDGQSIACFHTSETRLSRYKPGLKVFKINGLTSQFLFDLPGSTASFSSDDKLIATGGTDGNVRILDRNGTLLRNLTGHSQTITDISFSPDAQMIASSSEDKTVKLWSRDGVLIETLEHSDRANALSFSPDGKKLAIGVNDGSIVEWNLDLDDLLVRGCDWARDYLENNSNVSSSDKALCRDVARPQKP